MPKRKTVKKQRPVICADANQHVKEHTAKIRKEVEYYAKKMAEYKAKRDAQNSMAMPIQGPSVYDGLQPAEQ